MGVNDLPQLLRNSKEHPHSLDDLSGHTYGVDALIWIYKALFPQPIADLYHQHPPVPLTVALRPIEKFIEACKAKNVSLIWVIDGMRPDPKLGTTDARDGDVSTAQAKLSALLIKGSSSDYNEVSKLRKKSVTVQASFIYEVLELFKRTGQRYCGAPAEVGAAG